MTIWYVLQNLTWQIIHRPVPHYQSFNHRCRASWHRHSFNRWPFSTSAFWHHLVRPSRLSPQHLQSTLCNSRCSRYLYAASLLLLTVSTLRKWFRVGIDVMIWEPHIDRWTCFHQVLVQQPQILKTDSLVLTTLKPDGTQVLSTMQSPTGITTLTTPIQNTALQVPVYSYYIL